MPSYRAASSNSANAALSVTVNLPTGTIAGDALLVFACTSSGNTLTVSNSMTVVHSAFTGGTEIGYLWKKILVAGDITGGDITVTCSASAKIAAACVSLIGTDVNPIHVTTTRAETAVVASHPMPQVTTTIADTLIIEALLFKDASTTTTTTLTPPAGYTQRIQELGGGTSQQIIGIATDASLRAAGTWGGGNYVADAASTNAVGFTVAVSPGVQILRPQSLAVSAGMIGSSGGATAANEADAVDSTYNKTPTGPVNQIEEVILEPGADPGSGNRGGTLTHRVSAPNSVSNTCTVQLRSGSTIIVSWTESNVPTSPTTFTHTWNTTQGDAIADWTNLRIRRIMSAQ